MAFLLFLLLLLLLLDFGFICVIIDALGTSTCKFSKRLTKKNELFAFKNLNIIFAADRILDKASFLLFLDDDIWRWPWQSQEGE